MLGVVPCSGPCSWPDPFWFAVFCDEVDSGDGDDDDLQYGWIRWTKWRWPLLRRWRWRHDGNDDGDGYGDDDDDEDNEDDDEDDDDDDEDEDGDDDDADDDDDDDGGAHSNIHLIFSNHIRVMTFRGRYPQSFASGIQKDCALRRRSCQGKML